MLKIRNVRIEDKEFWYSLDKHLPEIEFDNKITIMSEYSKYTLPKSKNDVEIYKVLKDNLENYKLINKNTEE